MNKIGTKDLAKAIYESAKGKSGDALESAINNAVEFLAKKNLISKSSEVLNYLQEIIDDEHGKIRAKVLSKTEPTHAALEHIKHFLRERFKAKEAHLDWKEDRSLLGGVRIEVRNEVIDLSLKNKIDQLQNHLLEYSTNN